MYQKTKKGWCLFKVAVVALLGVLIQERAFGFDPGRIIVPVEYIKFLEAIQTQEGPANPSPFGPWFDPAPTMWFKPAQAPTWKPYLKTQDEIFDYGYNIYQKWATKVHQKQLYDPITQEYYGYENQYWQWDQGLGYRLQEDGWNWIDGDWWTDTGWIWSGYAQFDREKCGNEIATLNDYPEGSGYDATLYESRDAEWRLSNLRQYGQPDFEVAVWYAVTKYPYGDHRWTAAEEGTLKYYNTWRIFCVEPGTWKDITPIWIPRNYELHAWPYLGLDMKSYADNNADLPEWVEGT